MKALVVGLPPEANAWRHEGLPFTEEVSARTLEQVDAWGRVFLDFLAGKKVRPPVGIVVERPTDKPVEKKKPETDPVKIAGWFAKHS